MGMSKQLLMHFIRIAVREAYAARVPNQLVSDGTQDDQEDDVNEFAAIGAGSVVGAPQVSNNHVPNKRKKRH